MCCAAAVGVAVVASLASAALAAPPATSVLRADSFRRYIDKFNQDDEELYKNDFPNAAAWDFLKANIPLFACPDEDIERTYYFRWWTYRKHIRHTPDGWVITEFLPKVPWSGKHNTISCPAGHHFYEGRWLRDPKYLNDYAEFWFRKGGNPRSYSFWAADALYAYYLVRHDAGLVARLLDDLVRNYRAWEQSRLTPDGLFWQIDDRDGMEVSVGKSGKRATINSYMYGDARAIARIARLAGNRQIAEEYEKKAAGLRQLVQEQNAIGKSDYLETLKTYTRSHRRTLPDGRVVPWIDENLDPFTGQWIARTRGQQRNAQLKERGQEDKILHERGKDYNHSSYCDLIVTGLVGLRPRADEVVEVNPLVPDGTWDYFCLDNVSYHGRTLTVVWDKTGAKYGKGKGLCALADGREIARSDVLRRIAGRLTK
jgi:hypothetical protein